MQAAVGARIIGRAGAASGARRWVSRLCWNGTFPLALAKKPTCRALVGGRCLFAAVQERAALVEWRSVDHQLSEEVVGGRVGVGRQIDEYPISSLLIRLGGASTVLVSIPLPPNLEHLASTLPRSRSRNVKQRRSRRTGWPQISHGNHGSLRPMTQHTAADGGLGIGVRGSPGLGALIPSGTETWRCAGRAPSWPSCDFHGRAVPSA